MSRSLQLAGAVAAPLLVAATISSPANADVIEVQVQITNLAPAGGTHLTPFWAGFHDGAFDLYDLGSPASTFLERLAEDGATTPLAGLFLGSSDADNAGVTEGTIPADVGIPVIAPGGTATRSFRLNTGLATSRYFSYASMVVPSNDAFIANGNAMAFMVIDEKGAFVGADFTVVGSMVRDSGTEVNDEIPMNTAFFGQSMPDTGTVEGGVVASHPGFLPVGSGGILDALAFANADFTQPDYPIARITVTRRAKVRVRIENSAPDLGSSITPIWVALHDGTFDTYDNGAPATPALERIAEDGNTAFLAADFAASGAGGVDATLPADVGIPVVLPGGTATGILVADPLAPSSRWFSYASMLVPSNDAFIANGNPFAHPIFDEAGAFIGADFSVLGLQANDAGVEVNDEVPANTAFFGQMTPNTGVDENGIVHPHPGLLAPGSGGIVDSPDFVNADFVLGQYAVATFTLSLVPAADPDLSGDTTIDGFDMGQLLTAWGYNPGNSADLDANGTVDGGDLGLLLEAWGAVR